MKHFVSLSVLAIFVAWAVVFSGPIAASAETAAPLSDVKTDAATTVEPTQTNPSAEQAKKETKPAKKVESKKKHKR